MPRSLADAARGAAALSPATRWWLLVLALFLVFLARVPGALTSPRFWAEDGTVWFTEQMVYGLRAIGRPLSGYLQLAPRLIAAAASPFPVLWTPFIYGFLAIGLSSICCAMFALKRYRAILESDALRVGLCVLAAGAFYVPEIVATPTNVQWYLLLAGILLTLVPPDETPPLRRGLSFLASLAIGLTNPLLVYALPLVAFYFWKRRRLAAVHLGLILGLVLEIAIAVFLQPHLGQAANGLSSVHRFLQAAFATLVAVEQRVFFTALLGSERAAVLSGYGSGIAVAIGLFLSGAGATWLAGLKQPNQRLRVWGAVYLIVASVGVPLLLRDGGQGITTLSTPIIGYDRFFFIGSCGFAYLVALALQSRCAPGRQPGLAVALLFAVFAVGIARDFRVHRPRMQDWGTSARLIEHWRAERRAGRRGPAVYIPILPSGWAIQLPGALTNPSFEEGVLPWRPAVAAQLEVGEMAAEGKRALLLRRGGLAYQDFEPEGGSALQISASALIPCSETEARGRILIDTAGRSFIDGPRAGACDTWQPFTVQVTPSPGQMVRIHLECLGCRDGMLWDDVRVETLAAAQPN